ncbi:N-acetyltransferase domain-containing protein [Fusarium sp. LHS14.1]|nr:N-acetyltransferase domain-containing protein [Fusarium sp. LHS14.1]
MPLSYETLSQKDLTNKMLDDAAVLFRAHYGVWAKGTALEGKLSCPTPFQGQLSDVNTIGNRIKINPKQLRDYYLPDHADCSYARALLDGRLVGHALICRWNWNGKRVCWVTQLVVHMQYRHQGIATTLLRLSRVESDDIYGILSSNPFACMAAATSFGGSIINLPLDFIRQNAQEILKASPVNYVKTAVVKGSLFGHDSTDLVSGIDTQFFVDHEEPDAALKTALRRGWPLGNLPQGHEYVLVFPVKASQSDACQ